MRWSTFGRVRHFFRPVPLGALVFLGTIVVGRAHAGLTLVQRAALTTDAEGGSARPEVAVTPGRVFAVYLGNIATPDARTFRVKVLDAGLSTVIAERTLVSTTPAYGGPTDIRIAADGKDLYAFYETHRPSSQSSGDTFLWGARYTLDDAFTTVAATPEPIARSRPLADLAEGGELLDDPAPLVTPDAVHVVTRLKSSLEPAGRTIYRVRSFAKSGLAKLAERDLDLSSVADGRARVTSLAYSGGKILMALATTTGAAVREDNDDGAPSDVLLVTLRNDFTLDSEAPPRLLASDPDDRENYVTGLSSDGSCLTLAYKQAVGIPPNGEQRGHLKVFSLPDLARRVDEVVARSPWGPSGGEVRLAFQVVGSRVYCGLGEGAIGTGNAEVLVYELSPACGSGGCALGCAASAAPSSGQAPLTVRFTSQVTSTSCASSPATAWEFGDGGTSTEPNPSHTYAAPGVHAWRLTATADGATCTRSGSIEVSAPPGTASPSLVVPIVLSGARYVSEMTLTNRGPADARLTFSYTPAFGGGGGTATDTLGARRQRVVPDAVAYLRSLHGAIAPAEGERGGTLRVAVTGAAGEGDVSITVRTKSFSGSGTAGVAYRAIRPSEALTGVAYLCGLRQDGRDRSNAAVLNAGADADGAITLRLTVISGDPAAPRSLALPDLTLAPGGFAQLTGILATAGVANGIVKVERIAGIAPYYAYGVINDQVSSDGSLVTPLVPGAHADTARLTVPVLVETPMYASELILANVSAKPKSLRLGWVSEGMAGGAAAFTLDLAPFEQKLVPDLAAYMRAQGTPGIGPPGEPLVGSLFASVASGDASGLFAAARTATRAAPDEARYGVVTPAVPFGESSAGASWLFGLRQDAESRTNVALVNTGELGSTSSTLRVELFDGETGAKVATVDGLTLPARRFAQIASILGTYAPGVTNAYARVSRTSGRNPFLAYAVVNDGASPGERTGDGAYVAMEREVSDPFPESFGVFAAFTDEFVSFRQSMGLDWPAYQSWAGARFQDLGASWTRSNLQLVWDLVEPVVGGSFDWHASMGGEEAFAGASAADVQYLAVFHEGGGSTPQPGHPQLRNPLDDLPAWQRFVRAAVERYDGDGIDDDPSGVVIKHWQVGNETGGWTRTGRSPAEYVRWFTAAAEAAREADPEVRLVLIASTDGAALDPLHAEVIPALSRNGVRFDAVDLHHWSTADLASSRMSAAPRYASLLSAAGSPGVELWSCEHGTYVGTPAQQPGPPLPDQSQRDQARSLVVRYVVNRALGVKRILWNNLAAWRCFGGGCGSFFDRLGLVADGYGPGETMADVGKKRLAFHSYAMLSRRIDGTLAEPLGEVAGVEPEAHVYAYRDRATGETRLVAWADRATTTSVGFAAVRAEVTGLITDEAGTPRRHEVVDVPNGTLLLSLDADPVWVEAAR